MHRCASCFYLCAVCSGIQLCVGLRYSRRRRSKPQAGDTPDALSVAILGVLQFLASDCAGHYVYLCLAGQCAMGSANALAWVSKRYGSEVAITSQALIFL